MFAGVNGVSSARFPRRKDDEMHTDGTPRAALTVAAFCEALSIGRTTFYEQVRAGRIRVLKVGTRTLVPTSEVDAFLQKLST
jgi:excisionase family DNA binding protein